MLHCNGKCILAKRLMQEQKKDQQNPERKLENRTEVFWCSRIQIDIPLFSIPQPNHSNLLDGELSDRSLAVFHPPSI